MERMKRLSEKSESNQITQEELSKRFETVETQSAELAAAPQRSSSVLDSDIGLFIEDPTFIYQDFAKVRFCLRDLSRSCLYYIGGRRLTVKKKKRSADRYSISYLGRIYRFTLTFPAIFTLFSHDFIIILFGSEAKEYTILFLRA